MSEARSHDRPASTVPSDRQVQVLVVDDEPDMTSTTIEILAGRGLTCVGAVNAATGIAKHRELRPAVVLCDQRLPEMSGLELCATLRSIDADASLILMTGYASLDSAIAAVGQIDQYLTKPVPVDALIAAVEAGVARTEQRVAERAAAEELRRRLEAELRRQASHDALTSLANRSLFSERADHALRRRSRTDLVVCFFDLDDFKDVNDSYGHGAGDELLRVIGQRLADCVRPADTVARFGGDEFAILLEDTQLADALEVVDRVYAAISTPVRIADDDDVAVHLSVGMTSAGERDVTAEELLAEADAAMYAAKARGKNRYEIFEPSMRSASELRSRLRVELGGALDRGDFRMFFQPVVELPGERWQGVETLARWPHPQHGLLEPVDYAEIADAKGLIVDLDGWALMAACRAAACAPDLSIAVNVSGRSLRTPGFGDVVAAALTSADVPGSRLVIDVADLARDPERARPQIDALHDLGVAIALDSFTGDIPSLRLLRALGLKYLKLDPTVAADLVVGKAATTIAKALVDIAHELGIQTVARGVETARQRDVLSELGCDLAQGSLWAAPAPIEELTDAVNTGRQVAGRK